ncbi:MAG: ribonuclease P protein component [Bacteroidia bacterium]
MNRLPKKERLHGRSIIEKLFAGGKHFRVHPFKVIWIQNQEAEDLPNLRIGISVSKRISRKAVTRNRIKRLIREAYRTSKSPFSEKLGLARKHIDFFLVYQGTDEPVLLDLKEKINLILERLSKDL